jgi:hypothetical protein
MDDKYYYCTIGLYLGISAWSYGMWKGLAIGSGSLIIGIIWEMFREWKKHRQDDD